MDTKKKNVASGQIAANGLLEALLIPGLPTFNHEIPSYRANPDNPSQIIRTIGDTSEIGIVVDGKFQVT